MLVQSEYKVASDEVNEQCTTINDIVKKYDDTGMLIGEAPCTKDLITITDKRFQGSKCGFNRSNLYHYCVCI